MLIAHHNISPRGLEIAHEIGGIPMPSLAISKVAHPLRGFGRISLIAHPSMITPGRNVSVWPSDAYTGRQPRAEEAFLDPKAARQAIKADPAIGHLWDVYPDQVHEFQRSHENAQLAQYAQDKFGIDTRKYPDAYEIQRAIGAKPEFSWEEIQKYPGIRKYGKTRIELPPYERFTPSGNRRKSTMYTMDAVYKQMKKAKASQQGAEDWDYGPSSFRANVIRPFRSLSHIKESRESIIHPNDMEAIKNEFSNRFMNAGDEPLDAYRRGDPAAKELAAYARSLPTEYFEAKRKDIVPISAFGAAIVPHDDARSTQILQDAGIPRVVGYQGGDDARQYWMQTMKDFHFKRGGYAG